tara:strand:+ start:419 stop:1714 length:1296 start_codon:yes stop_codon:yes gene_type:complete
MKDNFFIHHLNHACVELITPNSSIITDPWIYGSCWANKLSLADKTSSPKASSYDYVFLSHSHSDHWHESIKLLDAKIQDSTFLLPVFGVNDYMTKNLRTHLTSKNKIIRLTGHSGSIFLNPQQKLHYVLDIEEHDASLIIETQDYPSVYIQTDNLMDSDKELELFKKRFSMQETSDIFIGLYIKRLTGIYPRFINGIHPTKSNLELEKIKDKKSFVKQSTRIKKIGTTHNFLYASSLKYTDKVEYPFPAIDDHNVIEEYKKNNVHVRNLKPGDMIFRNGSYENRFEELSVSEEQFLCQYDNQKINKENFIKNLCCFIEKKIDDLSEISKTSAKNKSTKYNFIISLVDQNGNINSKRLEGKSAMEGCDQLKELRFNINAIESTLNNKWCFPSMRELTNGGFYIYRSNKDHQSEFEREVLKAIYLPNLKRFNQ